MTQVRNYDPQLKGVVCKVTKSYLCAVNFIYQFVSHDFMHRLGSPGKAVWARQRLPASDFARLRLDGPAWRRQILQGTNQTSPDCSAVLYKIRIANMLILK